MAADRRHKARPPAAAVTARGSGANTEQECRRRDQGAGAAAGCEGSGGPSGGPRGPESGLVTDFEVAPGGPTQQQRQQEEEEEEEEEALDLQL